MLQSRSARRRIVTYALLVAVAILMLAFSSAAALQDVRHGINYALSPIQNTLAQGTRSVTSVLNAIGEIDQLRRENQDLGGQVQALQTQVQQLEALKAENDRLSALLGMKGTLSYTTEPAAVIGRQATQEERVLTLDRGTDAGINIGDPVLAPGGALAGMVMDAGQNYSSVMLINDTRSVVIGLDESTTATGEVDGRLSGPLAMGKIPSTQQVAVEDTVVTAGLDLGTDVRSPFPKGLLIGRIVDVQSDPSSIVQTALVQPAADLDNLEYVLVITSFKPSGSRGPGASGAPDATAHPKASGH